MKAIHLASALLGVASLADGAKLPMRKRASSSGVPIRAAKGFGSASQTASQDSITLTDFQDEAYMVDIQVGGSTFVVQLDTGSSDLWVFPNGAAITLTNTTDVVAVESYGIGACGGSVDFAEVKIGPYTIPSQAFLNVNVTEGMEEIFSIGLQGILGMSFTDDTVSDIQLQLDQAYGNGTKLGIAPISNIFAQNPNSPNCFDLLLTRAGDLDAPAGTFLIGEHLDDYASITTQPKLYKQWIDRWTLAMDQMSVNGQPFAFAPSSLPNLQPGQVAAVLDSGFTFPPLPPAAVDAIYSVIPGAINVSTLGLGYQWLVPCNSAVNLTFTFAGLDYPVHPLDITTIDVLQVPGANGQLVNTTVCYNTYQYSILSGPGFSGMDLVLGDSFLRNVYVSFNMGNADGSGNSSFVQLLSITNLDAAWPDFVTSRSQALTAFPSLVDPSIIASRYQTIANTSTSTTGSDSLGASSHLSSDSNPGYSDGQLTSLVEKYGPVVIGLLAGNVAIGLILCIIGLFTCLRMVVKSGAVSRSVNPSYAPVRFKEADSRVDDEYRD